MALRTIRLDGDEILRRVSKPVKKISPRTRELIDDMKETMVFADGVGLAAVQVGVLKRLFLVDIGDEHGTVVFINPELTELSGEQIGLEGCLSVPDENGIVKRADHVKVKYMDENWNEQELEATGFLARAIQHEYDHINGILYIDKAEVMNPNPEDYPEYFQNRKKSNTCKEVK